MKLHKRNFLDKRVLDIEGISSWTLSSAGVYLDFFRKVEFYECEYHQGHGHKRAHIRARNHVEAALLYRKAHLKDVGYKTLQIRVCKGADNEDHMIELSQEWYAWDPNDDEGTNEIGEGTAFEEMVDGGVSPHKYVEIIKSDGGR